MPYIEKKDLYDILYETAKESNDAGEFADKMEEKTEPEFEAMRDFYNLAEIRIDKEEFGKNPERWVEERKIMLIKDGINETFLIPKEQSI